MSAEKKFKDNEHIEMLDALGYLRSGSKIWMRVPKNFSLDFNHEYPNGDHMICEDEEGKPFDYVSTAIIQKLLDEGYIHCRIEPDTSNANSDVVLCELEEQGQNWHLIEYPHWQDKLHHRLE